MTLYFYFARKFATVLAGLFGLFAVLYGLLDMVEVIRKLGPYSVGFLEILMLTALKIPGGIYQILPLIVILSTLVLFLGLARSSELVVARASGRSALRSLIAPVIVAFLLGVIAIGAFNPIVAATSKQYDQLLTKYRKGTASALSVSREGLWLRQGSDTGQTVIRATRANLDGTEFFDVTFLGFGLDGTPSFRIEAQSAELLPGAWVAHNAKEWRFKGIQNAEKQARTFAELRIESNLTGDEIRDGFGTPDAIPIWELPRYISRLEEAGFSARRHRVWFQTELAKPLMLVAMVLIGAAFTMRHTRFGRTGVMVTMALMMAFGIYFIRNFVVILGENGQLPVLLAAWATPVSGVLLALGLLLHMEDG
ncbi:MAG: LPS export ABC transporter permease LptG [Marinosulfonomonas sp.]|nr:LPS export ABC transporter permease LptG [Marinosulfonomonas sp.]